MPVWAARRMKMAWLEARTCSGPFRLAPNKLGRPLCPIFRGAVHVRLDNTTDENVIARRGSAEAISSL